MPNKRVEVYDNTKNDPKNDVFDKIIQSLTPNNNGISPNKPNDIDKSVERQQTIVDEYLEILKMRRQIADTLFRKYLIPLLNERDNVDPAHIKEMATLISLYLGVGDRWSNDVLKNAIINEMGIFGGFTSKIYPEYIGDPYANFERSQAIGVKDDTSMLIANLLQLFGINLSPEMIDKLAKLFKENLGKK